VDEYGILKLADFKFTQKIPKDSLGESPIANRGCAPYMAPELFTSEGVHSFQSDFWSLGCVLYELRMGFLPFGDMTSDSLETVRERIRTLDPVLSPLPQSSGIPNISPALSDCLLWLLEKAPMNRCSW
jgi:serine/threonine-protein kinase ULK4